MRTKKFTVRVLAGLTLLAGVACGNAAAQKVEDVLARTPIQAGVVVTTPAGANLAGCKAERVAWPAVGGVTPKGIVVKDAKGNIVRQFIDSKGTGKENIWSYYSNGVEAYREVDGNGNGKVDQFRWLGPNGGKWGIDVDEDGKVDTWIAMSAEELSQELFQAILTRDPKRVEALLVTQQDLTQIGLPAADANKLLARAAGAAKKLNETAETLKLTQAAKWVHMEVGIGSTTPADVFGGRQDLVKQRSAMTLVDKGDNKAEVFSTGEIIQVVSTSGTITWKLIDGPSSGTLPAEGQTGTGPVLTPEIQALVTEAERLPQPKTDAEQPAYHAARAAIYEKIIGKTQGSEQEPWLKQVIEEYSLAADGGPVDGPAMVRLKQWVTSIETNAPASAAAAYAAYRVLSTEYNLRIVAPKPDFNEIQKWWRTQLEAYVNHKYYSKSDDAPEAMMRLAVAFEFADKGEADAKKWYERLANDFKAHPHAARAVGSVKRLNSEGQPFALSGQTAVGSQPFDMSKVQGRAVVVYYWASWGRGAAAELKLLGELEKEFGPKGLTIVTVNLDDDAAKAKPAGDAIPGGIHLHSPGGLDGAPLATAYGIQTVPHIFVVGKDGKVTNRNAQVGPMMKDEVEKLVK